MDRVLIVGGGIGGLALAGALGRRGVEVHVVDNQPEWSITALGHRPAGARGPRSRGARARRRRRRGRLRDDRLQVPRRDEHAARDVRAAAPRRPRAPGTIGILRWPLHTILLGAAEDAGAQVRLRRPCSARRSQVELSDGDEAPATTCSSAPTGSARASASSRSTVTPRRTTPGSSCGERCSTARPRSTTSTSTTLRARRAACARSPTRRCTCSPCSPSPSSIACRPRTSRRSCASCWPASAASPARSRDRIVDPEQVVRRPVEAILVDPPWHRGRTVLIGDAVHAPPPTLAAGAAIALEDAVVLDEMLAGGGEVEATLRAFVDRRFER